MSYYALVAGNIVQQVISADENYIQSHLLSDGEEWVLTSYGTYGNVHYTDNVPDGLPPFRGNYACIGYTWDVENDVFYAPQPYPSWTLSTTTWLWEPPVPKPDDNPYWEWDEATQSWVMAAPVTGVDFEKYLSEEHLNEQ